MYACRDVALACSMQRGRQYPAMNQAGVYAGTLHYLKAVAALKALPMVRPWSPR